MNRQIKEWLIIVVNVEYDDKNYRTMNEVRRNRRLIVAMQFGSKKANNKETHKGNWNNLLFFVIKKLQLNTKLVTNQH
ncbi:MAG TPA: hypothetical protein VL095_13695 [Flavisolibacter sp.]|nr:hypothetical protein [Flavisolibacter sp.]